MLVTGTPRPTAGIILTATVTDDVILTPHTHTLGFINDKHEKIYFFGVNTSSRFLLPVVVAVAKRPNRDGEGLPRWIQRVLDHLCLVADGEPGRETSRHEEEEKEEKKCRVDLHCPHYTSCSYLSLFHDASSQGWVYLSVCIRGVRQMTDW